MEPRANELEPALGNRRLVGQQDARRHLQDAAESRSVSHAWLLSGPVGSGTTALALAFAEWLQGVDHLSDLGGRARSRKSSWHAHPDIHLFLPLTTTIAKSESDRVATLKERRTLLAEDPYTIADLRRRPSLDGSGSSNLRPIYPIIYMNEVIRQVAKYRQTEGEWVISILTEVETFNQESANAFLKLLEEPPPNHLFLLTTHKPAGLLPTILSRCQQVRLGSLPVPVIEEALVRHDGMDPESARFLSRACNGNYEEARTIDPDDVRTIQQEQIDFFRACWTQDATTLFRQVETWHKSKNREAQLLLCQSMQRLVRDILVYRETGNSSLLVQSDARETLASMSQNLPDARFEEIFHHLEEAQHLLGRNIQFKLLFTSLAIRFGYLLRGEDPPIPDREAWRHLPAVAGPDTETT